MIELKVIEDNLLLHLTSSLLTIKVHNTKTITVQDSQKVYQLKGDFKLMNIPNICLSQLSWIYKDQYIVGKYKKLCSTSSSLIVCYCININSSKFTTDYFQEYADDCFLHMIQYNRFNILGIQTSSYCEIDGEAYQILQHYHYNRDIVFLKSTRIKIA